jgi:hypothetical protein
MQIFKIHFMGIFRSNFPRCFRAPGPGLASWGAQRLQRVCARRRAVPGNTPNSSSPPTAKIRLFRRQVQVLAA